MFNAAAVESLPYCSKTAAVELTNLLAAGR